MAGDWIPVTVGLQKRREVVGIASRTGRDIFEVVGLLVTFWGWVSEESNDGTLLSLCERDVCRAVGGDEPFWSAVIEFGWLSKTDTGLVIPNWDRWMGASAKKRLQDVIRQRRRRENNRPEPGQKPVTKKSRTQRDRCHTTDDRGQRTSSSPLPPNGGSECLAHAPPGEEPGGNGTEPDEIPEAEAVRLYVDGYNEHVRPSMPNQAEVKTITDARRRSLLARVDQYGSGIWNLVVPELKRLNDFARKGTWMDFDYLISEKGCAKLLEGSWRKDTR